MSQTNEFPPPSAEGARGWVDSTSALQARLATANDKNTTASNANVPIANKANTSTSVITKETHNDTQSSLRASKASVAIHKIKEKTLTQKKVITLDRLPRFCTLKRNLAMTVWWIATNLTSQILAMTNNQRAMTKDLPTPKPPPAKGGGLKKPNTVTLRGFLFLVILRFGKKPKYLKKIPNRYCKSAAFSMLFGILYNSLRYFAVA